MQERSTCDRCKERLQVESAGVAASLGGRAASGGLEPLDELLNGEGLGESRAVAGGRSGGGSGLGGRGSGRLGRLDGRGSGGRSGAGGRSGGSSRLDGLGGGGGSAAGGGGVPDLGAGDSVVGGTTVDVEHDTGVGGLVSLGHVDTSGGESSRAAASDLDLTTAVVELGLALGAGLVETNHLGADEVVTSLKVGEVNLQETLGGDEVVNTPLGAGKTVLVDLGPDGALTVGVGLGDVDHDGSLVGGCDRVITVTGGGGVVVVPLHTDLGASSNLDLVGSGLATVANHGSGGDIEDGVVAVGRSLDSEMLALVLAVNDEALEGGVRSGKVGSSQDDSSLGEHVCGRWVGWLVGWFEKVERIFKDRMETNE